MCANWIGIVSLIPVLLFSSIGCSQVTGSTNRGNELVQPALTINLNGNFAFKRVNVLAVVPLEPGEGTTPPNEIELQELTKQLNESFEVYSRFRVMNVEERDRVNKALAAATELEGGGLPAVAKLGRQLDVDLIVSGVVSDFGGTKIGKGGHEIKDYQNEGNINIRLWLTDPKSGRTVATITYQKRRDSVTDNLFNAREALSEGIVSKGSAAIAKDAFVQIAKKVDSLK